MMIIDSMSRWLRASCQNCWLKRSFGLVGWLTTFVFVLIGLPLYLRMPPWCDLTLYEVAARTVLEGGVHYQDIFDTNLPGFVWALVGVRTVFGPSPEAVRIVDFGIVAVSLCILSLWVSRSGGNHSTIAWMMSGSMMFYLFISEYSHCQRDVWMMLPILLAAFSRLSRFNAAYPRIPYSVMEGFLFGVAVWIKPHALIMSAAVWLATWFSVSRFSLRLMIGDGLGTMFGGLVAASLGIVWLMQSGAWCAFLDVMQFWNPGYLTLVFREFPSRWPMQFFYFPPWSWFQPLGVACAAWAMARPSQNPYRFTLAVLYVVWMMQGLFLQRMFDYVHVPETFLMFALLATYNVPVGFVGLVLIICGLVSHPIRDTSRLAWWPACWNSSLTPEQYWERRNALGFQKDCFNGIDWVQLSDITDYLHSQRLSDHKLIAWHDTPHALYLLLGIRPGFRFMHVSTVTQIGEPHYQKLRDELHHASRSARFVVADLERVFNTSVPGEREKMQEPGHHDDLLPPGFRTQFPRLAKEFPFHLKSVFRSRGGRGRYVVFQLDHPVTTECRIPAALGVDLDQ